jgi:hypothetical protein
VDTQVKVVEAVDSVIEVVQNQDTHVGLVTAVKVGACVLKVVGVVLVGVQLVQHVGVVLPLTTGVRHNIQDTVVLFVMLVTTVGRIKHMAVKLTAKV